MQLNGSIIPWRQDYNVQEGVSPDGFGLLESQSMRRFAQGMVGWIAKVVPLSLRMKAVPPVGAHDALPLSRASEMRISSLGVSHSGQANNSAGK